MILRNTQLRLSLILTLGFLVRVWGIGFGLPQLETRPDEIWTVRTALGFFSGDLNPHFFDYPTLYISMVWVLYIGYFFIGRLLGWFGESADLFIAYVGNPTHLHLIARYLAASLGTATIFLVYRLTSRLFHKSVAIMASLFLSLSYLHVRESHFAKIDVPMTFFLMLSMIFILRVYRLRRKRDYIFAGLFCGLAISTKYAALPILLALLIAHLTHFLSGRTIYHRRALRDRKIRWALVAATIGFFVGTPFSVLAYPEFQADVSALLLAVKEGYLGIVLGSGWAYHLKYSLFYGIGWPMFGLSLVGIVMIVLKKTKIAAILFIFPLIYYFLIGESKVRYVRYAVPIIPFLSVASAYAVFRISTLLSVRLRGISRNALILIISAISLIPSMRLVVESNRHLSIPDSRVLASDWIRENLSQASSVYQVGSLVARLNLYPSEEELEMQYKWYAESGDNFSADMTLALLAVMKEQSLPSYTLLGYDHSRQQFVSNSQQPEDTPDVIIVYETPILFDKRTDPVPEAIFTLLSKEYLLTKVFTAFDIENQSNIYDHQDAFYLPYAGFNGIQRPGPNIFIYQLKGASQGLPRSD